MTNPRQYASDAKHAAFPLGGIGTGNISLGARGDLRDFEIFGHPDKGNLMPYSFFAIRAEANGASDARVLEAKIPPEFNEARGYHPTRVAGIPHMEKSTISVQYPFATVAFEDAGFPAEVTLTAFTPFVPLDADASGIPGAVFRYAVRNPSAAPIEVSIAGSMPNMYGFRGHDQFDNYIVADGSINKRVTDGDISGLVMDGEGIPETSIRYANNAIMTREGDISAKVLWPRTGWWDGIYDFWRDFSSDGRLETALEDENERKVGPSGAVVGSIAISKTIPAGGEATFEFVLSWYVPSRVKGWAPFKDDDAEPTIRNYYATQFTGAWDAGTYLLRNLDSLESKSRAFADALYASTLPESVIDAAASNITALRSTTCMRIEDGTFVCWEGSHEHTGSCAGTCTHVWNYAQTVAFLFPELEKTARYNEFMRETKPDGKMNFRTNRVFGREPFEMYAAADGQLGTIVRAYREWSLTGDDEWLKTLWPKIKLALGYTALEWDLDGDELLESRQHNTYDIEFYGVNPLTGVMYLAALAAMSKMAVAMGEPDLAAEYDRKRALSAERLDAASYNGEYYIQPIEDVNAHPYQFGTGCLSDQLLGQTLAYVAGLGPLLPDDHRKSAVLSIFNHNFKQGPERGTCLQRLYVADDEPGLVLASWPDGGEPLLPFVYADEVWTGIEYHVATLLIYEGYIDEAITIIDAVRARQDGYRRNPWDEVECGFHYARSLASWGPIVALSGARYDAKADTMRFEPKINAEDFHCFYSNGKHWGMLHQVDGVQRVEVMGAAGKPTFDAHPNP